MRDEFSRYKKVFVLARALAFNGIHNYLYAKAAAASFSLRFAVPFVHQKYLIFHYSEGVAFITAAAAARLLLVYIFFTIGALALSNILKSSLK